jgi:hypothetical protein
MIRVVVAVAIITMTLAGVEILASDFTRPDLRIVVDNVVIRTYHGAELTDRGVYIPARKFSEMFDATIMWRSDIESVLIFLDGRTYMPSSGFMKNSTAMINAQYLEQIFGHTVEYFPDINLLFINTRGDGISTISNETLFSILPSFDGYSEEDLFWLSRIIHAEARGERFEGMLAVGSVVMNRKYHPQYPDTVREVIFDRRNGIQFSPTANGSINNNPSIQSFIAAMEVLEGKRNASSALFFMNPSIARSTWMRDNRPYAFTLQSHAFFY